MEQIADEELQAMANESRSLARWLQSQAAEMQRMSMRVQREINRRKKNGN